MNRSRKYLATALVVCATAASASACSSAKSGASAAAGAADGPVTITVNNEPPATETVAHAHFLADVAAFEAKHPTIKIEAHEGQMDPSTFSTKLAGGQLENVFYVYLTDPAGLIAKHQASDISSLVAGDPAVAALKPGLTKIFQDKAGKTYGLPIGNYTMGLVYSRKLFTQAGLDPDKPPTTWDEVRADASKIAALGGGIAGYGDYSKSNTGGWHFTAEMYSIGGDVAKQDDSGVWKADFNNDKGRQILNQLHDMRWTDNSMGDRQLLEWKDLLQMMGSGKLGMYVATADNIPTIVNQYNGNIADYGLAPIPNAGGTLGGGAGMMFNPKNTAAQNKAGLAWVEYEYLTPGQGYYDAARNAADKSPVGTPEPDLWTGDTDQKFLALNKQYSNVPSQNYTSFLEASSKIPMQVEPPQAQKVYAVLDTAMATVLTEENADVAKLLSDAEGQVNTILATVK